MLPKEESVAVLTRSTALAAAALENVPAAPQVLCITLSILYFRRAGSEMPGHHKVGAEECWKRRARRTQKLMRNWRACGSAAGLLAPPPFVAGQWCMAGLALARPVGRCWLRGRSGIHVATLNCHSQRRRVICPARAITESGFQARAKLGPRDPASSPPRKGVKHSQPQCVAVFSAARRKLSPSRKYLIIPVLPVSLPHHPFVASPTN